MNDERLARLSALHHAAADELDAVTRARLAAARQRAIAATGTRTALPGWLPAAAFASVAVVALGVGLTLRTGSPEPAAPGIEAVELLLAEEDLAFFEEDAAFYEWAVEVADAS